MLLDQAGDGGPKGALLVGADPDEEPVWALDAGRESGADAGTRADADAALEHGGGVADASWRVLEHCFDHNYDGRHTELELTCPYCFGWVGHEVLGEVTLHAADHVVVRRFAAWADDAEGMVFHDGCATDAA